VTSQHKPTKTTRSPASFEKSNDSSTWPAVVCRRRCGASDVTCRGCGHARVAASPGPKITSTPPKGRRRSDRGGGSPIALNQVAGTWLRDNVQRPISAMGDLSQRFTKTFGTGVGERPPKSATSGENECATSRAQCSMGRTTPGRSRHNEAVEQYTPADRAESCGARTPLVPPPAPSGSIPFPP